MAMVLAVGLGSSGCVLSGVNGFETITDAGISNAEEIDVSEEKTLIVVETSVAVPETDESMGQEVSSDITEFSVASEEPESPEVTELPEASEETESVETTESNPEPATETTPEIPREEPAEEVNSMGLSYPFLTDKEKAELFRFLPDDNNYNLELHMAVLKACGLKLEFDEVYEDYQRIYDKTMEMQDEKMNERGESGRGRAR